VQTPKIKKEPSGASLKKNGSVPESSFEVAGSYRGDLSPDGKSTENLRRALRDVQERGVDMQQVAKQFENASLNQNLLSMKEVNHHYALMKEESLRDTYMVDSDYEALNAKLLDTLKHLMFSLMLHAEFSMIESAFKLKEKQLSKSKGKADRVELVLKALLRCRNLFEAKHEVAKILVAVRKREALLNNFEAELYSLSAQEAKTTYFALLKLGFRVWNQIDRLRVDNPLLNRPFVLGGSNV